MFKHATICRTNKAQEALRRQKELWSQQSPSGIGQKQNGLDEVLFEEPLSPLASLMRSDSNRWRFGSSSCSTSPTPNSTPSHQMLSAPSSVFNSPSKHQQQTTSSTSTLKSPTQTDSMIRIFAQALSQDVEYVTFHASAQTKSKEIVRSLLKKFRLKHRDPNLFYLTLERIIRKEGLKTKSIMLLGDDACPLQLQQCCSNPPHNDIKFTLQMHTGALMKIHCSDVCPSTRYKCLSLSAQTTADEAIELILHCLNLHRGSSSSNSASSTANQQHQSKASSSTAHFEQQTQPQTNQNHHHIRQSSSPATNSLDSCSATSTSSSASSSSGIDSDPTNNLLANTCHRPLNLDSRASSVTSLSSSSNVSNNSSLAGDGKKTSANLVEPYCLIIECKDTNYRRILQSDECLVDVYQNLLDEAKSQTHPTSVASSVASGQLNETTSETNKMVNASQTLNRSLDFSNNELISQQPDQWFIIKLKRRDTISPFHLDLIRTTNPHKQSMSLPPIPQSLSLQFNNANSLKHIVSTTQIEVNPRPGSSLGQTNINSTSSQTKSTTTNEPPSATTITAPTDFGSNSLGNNFSPLAITATSQCNEDALTLAQTDSCCSKNSGGGAEHKSGDNNNNNNNNGNPDVHRQLFSSTISGSSNDHFVSSVAASGSPIATARATCGGGNLVGFRNNNPFIDDTQHQLYGNSEQIQLHHRQMSAICSNTRGNESFAEPQKMPPPPASLIWLPPIRPRKRNLSNASSTFQRPPQNQIHQQPTGGNLKITGSSTLNRRRYDPIQLAKDLNELDLTSNLQPDPTDQIAGNSN